MRLLFLSSLMGIMCSCAAPKLETNGIIGCWIFDGGSIKHEFDYPSDTRSRQLLNEWLNYYNSQSYWLTLAEAQVPAIELSFPNKKHVCLYDYGS